jgi:hypothetical protein
LARERGDSVQSNSNVAPDIKKSKRVLKIAAASGSRANPILNNKIRKRIPGRQAHIAFLFCDFIVTLLARKRGRIILESRRIEMSAEPPKRPSIVENENKNNVRPHAHRAYFYKHWGFVILIREYLNT